MSAITDVIAERARQLVVEEYTEQHDDQEHMTGDLALAAACYARGRRQDFHDVAMPGKGAQCVPTAWPWDPNYWKPKNYRRDLVRAAALLIAEIDRIDRATAKSTDYAP